MSEEKNLEIFAGEAMEERVKVQEKGPPKIKEVNRNQMFMRAVDVEQLIEAEHPARGIWEFVSGLELNAYYEGIQSEEGEAGRAAWDPRVLISLWLFAYSEGVSSAREVSRRCEYHPAYQWLTGMEIINYHTLSDFRIKNKGLNEMFKDTLGVMSYQGLIGLERVAHDGTKIKANAKGSSFRGEASLQEHLEAAQKHLEAMGDPREDANPRKDQAAKRAARERREKVQTALRTLKEIQTSKPAAERDRVRVSQTDPDARIMKQADGGYAPSFNVQATTDAQAGLIVGIGVTQSGNDRRELSKAMQRVQEILVQAPKQVLVDTDYVTRETILEMANSQSELISSVVDRKGISDRQYERRGVAKEFHSEAFCYNQADDTFTCPAGKTLTFDRKETRPGITSFFYNARRQDCQQCIFKQQCCPKTQARSVGRNVEEKIIQEFNARMQTPEVKAIYKQRSQLAEFCNAWIKDKMRLRQFRLRGLIKVTLEITLAAIAFNIKQWIRLRWLPQVAAAQIQGNL